VEEIVGLSGRERDRLVVLRQVKEGKLPQRKAAEQLGLSSRWVKKLMKRLKSEGDRGLAHRLRGRASNRGHGAEVRKRAMELVGEQYADYGPTLASEVLAGDHAIEVNRETLRQWMSKAQIWKPRRQKIKRVHVWRQRREQRGELVQWDTSEHLWLEGRGEKLYLIAMIDDATSELTARFAPHDSSEENMRLLWRYIEQNGRPVEVYTDKAGLFQVNRPLHYNKHLPSAPEETQIKRALEELGIGRIAAHSPQAKGRVERSFGTMQDRLVKGLRRAGASTLDAANQYLWKVFEPEWKQRFAKRPASQLDAHRALRKDHHLASALSYVEMRMANNDYTLRWFGERYQIAATDVRPRMRKSKLRVEQRLDGALVARWEGREMQMSVCPEPAPAQPEPKQIRPRKAAPKGRWMDGFWHGDPAKKGTVRPVTPVALRAPSVTGRTG
jgi:biotin operon repressor/transposase-like protein